MIDTGDARHIRQPKRRHSIEARRGEWHAGGHL